MKKAFIVIIAAVATIACTKESTIQDNNIALEGGLLSVEATVAPFIDDATKASISVDGSGAVTGTFSWSPGDQIAFPVTASGSPAYVALTYNPANEKFEGTLGDGQEVNYSGTIYYPASVVIGPTYSTNFASIDAAKAGFKMTASVPASLSQKITMTHESALVHVQFTNVPDFADKLVVSDGSDIATISTGSASGDIHFYVPITPAGEKTYTFTLKDNNENVIKNVSKAKALVAGKFYNTPTISINNYVMFTGSTNDTHRIGLGVRKYDRTWLGSWATYDLNKLIDGRKYIILPDTYANAEAIQVELRQNDGADEYAKSQTEYVLPVRTLTFDVSENSMKMGYRCYAQFSDAQWGYWFGKGDVSNVKFRWGYGSRPAISGSDADCSEVTVTSGKLFYYEFPKEMYGYDNVYWGFYNEKDNSWTSDWDNATINSDMLKVL